MILCSGEALIDMLPGQTADGALAHVPHCGGAVFNTAIGLGRLGAPVSFFSAISTDGFGDMLRQALEASDVDTSLVVRPDRLTTLAMVHLKDGHANYSFYDENSAGAMLTSEDLPPLLPHLDALFFGGISLCNAPAADSYLAFAERVKGQAPIMIDPNVRPGFAKDEMAYRNRLTRFLGVAQIVKLSDEDLNWFVPGNIPLEDKANRILEYGPSLLLLTKGSEGAVAFQRNGDTISVAAQKADVIDTVGAGDTFNSGFLTALHERSLIPSAAKGALSGTDMTDCLSFAAQVAAITVSRKGANPPWRSELPN